MAISNFHGMNPIIARAPIAWDLLQCRGFEAVKHFEGQELFAHDVEEAQEGTETLTGLFEQNFSPCQKSKPVLRTLLNRILQWFDPKIESELVERSFPLTSKSSCMTGLAVGTCGSLLTQHPFPLLLGLSQCVPSAQAQARVGSEFQVNNYTIGGQGHPSVASFFDGHFVVTWHSSQERNGSGIYGQLFDENGAKIGSEFQANTYTPLTQRYVSVSSLNNGNFVVTWESDGQDGSGYGIFGQMFNKTGSKIQSEFQINTYTNNSQINPSVTSLNIGGFVVVWQSSGLVQDGSGYGVYGQMFNENGTKIQSEFQINTYTINDQIYPYVTSLNNGNFVIVWSSFLQDSSGYGAYGQLFDENGNKVGSEFRINSYTWNDQIVTWIASLSSGNFIVTWMGVGQYGDKNVFGGLFDGRGEKIGSEFQINSETVEDQTSPNAVSLSNDHIIVAWHSFLQDGSDWGVYGQLFNNKGFKIGSEFRINNYTVGHQAGPRMAGVNNGSFVVTWGGDSPLDQSGWGVSGQIFHDNYTLSSSSSTTSTSYTTTTTLSSMTTTSIASTTSSSRSIMRSIISTTNTITTDKIPVTFDITSKSTSPLPHRNNVLAWLAFLFGGAACVASFVHAGYTFYKSKRREERGDTIELREKGSFAGVLTSESGERRPEEEHYQRTPDHVHPL